MLNDLLDECKKYMLINDNLEKINYKKIEHGNNNDKLIIKGEAHEDVDCEITGDLILKLNVKEHKEFRRQGNDLFITKQINLVDALCGFDLTITHLDNRKMLVKTGDIISPKTMKKINGEGFNNGDLVIDFEIVFPKTLSRERKEYISKLLPVNKKQDTNYDGYELKMLENYEKKFEQSYKTNNNDNLEDNEDANIGCATQ